ncbi:MAG: LamG-like jellyroll fold domain-containing protein [Limisphaerales bacterium]
MALCLGGVSWAGLIQEWTGDHYTSGNWTDDVGGIVATASGSPLAVANAFGTHTGVNVNGGYFAIPAGAGVSGLSNFTIVVVIRPTAVGPNTQNYYNGTPLAAYDIPGSGQDDVGLSWAGVSVVDGCGQQQPGGNNANGDVLELTPNLALNVTHAVAYQVNATALTVSTYADGALVSSEPASNIMPRSSLQITYVGGGTFGTPTFPGQIAAIQFYNDATTNCAILTQDLLNTYAPLPITLPGSSGAAVGKTASVTIGVPASAVQSGPLTVTLTSGTPGVVASTTVPFAKNQASATVNLPIVSLGSSTVTASATGLTSATMVIAGLDYSGLSNDWLANDYTNNSTEWIDSVSGVVATGTGVETTVPNVFGPGNQGVERNNIASVTGPSGFIIPGGTPPAGLTDYTIAVVFKPTAVGPNNANYYGSDIMFGYDIGGTGQHDFGMSWGGGNGVGGGQQIVVGIGRVNGDSQIQSLPNPLALNVTHAAVMQVNGTAGTFTLYVDGLECGQVTGIAMNQVSDQPIEMIQQDQSNIGQAFDGYLGEAQVYTNDNINGAVLSSILQTKYQSFPPILLTFQGYSYVDISNSVTLTVGIPASSSANGPFTVTLTSDNTAVVGSTAVTFPQGVTSTNISCQILGFGAATITASGANLSSVSVTIGGLYPRSLVETFHASSLTNQVLGIATGDQVGEWDGDILGTPAYGQANPPTFNAAATLAGTPSVVFVGTDQNAMDIPAVSDVTAGLTNFSVVAVFQASAVGAGGVNDGQWWNDAGIADHELPGTTFDWGLELDSGGYFEWGTGDPDHEIQASAYTVVNPLFHVVIGTYDTLNGISTVTVDDTPSIVNSNLFSQPRLPDDIRIGYSHDNTSAWLSGQLVELDFWNGALEPAERSNVISSLKSSYSLIWPNQALLGITANPPDGEVGSIIPLTVSIPAGDNNNSAVTVTVTSGTPSVATIAGGASANLTFPAGGTNVQTVSAQIVGVGSSVVVVTNPSPVLISSSVTLVGLAAPSAVETFHASSLPKQIPGIANGNPIQVWYGDILNTPANANPNPPTYHATATASGTPSVVLNATNETTLDIPSADDPTAGLSQFSVLAVFKDYNVAVNDGGNFYQEAGIADHEIPGVTYDWGLEINGLGEFAWGTGDPDTTIPYPEIVVNDGLFHIVVGTYDVFSGVSAVYVDNGAPQVVTGLQSGARLPQDIVIGAGHPGSYLSGELAELDFYQGAMTSNEVATAVGALEKTYGIAPPVVRYPLTVSRSGSTVQISWPVAATTAGAVLQSTTNLLDTWSASGLSFVTNGANIVATDGVTNAAKYYRLSQPK